MTVCFSDVDRSRHAGGHELGDLCRRPCGETECLGEVVAGSRGYYAQAAAAAGLDDGARNPAARSVAADGDDDLGAVVECVVGEGLFVPRAFRFMSLGDSECGKSCADGGNRRASAAASGGGIDDEAGVRQWWARRWKGVRSGLLLTSFLGVRQTFASWWKKRKRAGVELAAWPR